jgi:steroid 5-alpha reductase family enzyme
VHVREMIGKDTNPALWQLFNFVFISVYQHVLLMLIAAPAYAAYVSKKPVGPADWLLCVAVIVLVGLEGLADEQQWVFQNAKYTLLKQHRGQLSRLPSEYRAGFIQSGLFRMCR